MNNLHEMIKRADDGDKDAMFRVAWDIVWGDPEAELEPELAEKALGYYFQLAQDGDCDSMLDLGAMYLDGRGVEKNESKALSWYRKAADMVYPKAFRCIGNYWMYYSDSSPDVERAFDAFVKGSICDEQNSLYELGDIYRKGDYMEKDDFFAFALYERAGEVIARNDFSYENGDVSWDDCYSDVRLRLGECYLDGVGTSANIEMAVEYLQDAVNIYKRRIAEGDDPKGVNSKQLVRAQESLADALQRQDLAEGSKYIGA